MPTTDHRLRTSLCHIHIIPIWDANLGSVRALLMMAFVPHSFLGN
jgi:hypothetical protein